MKRFIQALVIAIFLVLGTVGFFGALITWGDSMGWRAEDMDVKKFIMFLTMMLPGLTLMFYKADF